MRSLAKVLPPNSALRRRLSGWWGGFLLRRRADVAVSLHGQTVLLDARWRSLDPYYEREALGGFLRVLREGDKVWDVGSHIGLYALLAAKRVGAKGAVVAWEPSPLSFAELNHHLRINAVAERCRTINELIAERAQEAIDFALDGHAADRVTNRIYASALAGQQCQIVKLKSNTLDYWAERLGCAPDVMKIDIEGAEWFAFPGARRLLRGEFGGKRPKILLSSHPASIWQYGGDVAALDRQIAELGYARFDLRGQPAVIDDYAEYWLIPREDADTFARG